MPKPINIPLPLKGINRNNARSEQPADTAWAGVNVLPYDRYGRLRIGQKPGTVKLYPATLSGSSQNIGMLRQATIALDPSTVAPDVLQLSEPFVYANATTLASLGGGTLWRVSQNGANNMGLNTVTTAAALFVNTNLVRANGTRAAAIYTPTLTLGSAYVVSATVTVSNVSAGVSDDGALLARVNKSTFAVGEGVMLSLSRSVVALMRSGGATTVTSYTFPTQFVAGTSHTLELRVNGNIFQGWVDGVQYVTGTITTDAANTGIGLSSNSSTNGRGLSNFAVYTGTTLASYRSTYIVAVESGNVYQGTLASNALVNGGTGMFTDTSRPQGATISGIMYLVNGQQNAKALNLTTQTIADIVPTAGAETAITLGQYQYAASWRGRLVLGADRLNPQNFVMSRSGAPTDFDYSQTDSAAAFAGNASAAGQLGDPITALMPYSDDTLLIGGDHNLWRIDGDPADGGSINLVSDAIGVLGPDAWTKSPDGTVYFVGTGGFYRMAAGGSPENIAGEQYQQIFSQINRGNTYVQLAWDRDRMGAWIFLTPVNVGSVTHLFYDLRKGGFWPIQFPSNHGPMSVLVYDGDAPTDRQILLGGRVGFIQKFSDTALDDDGVAITSNLTIGPFQPATPTGDAVITGLDITMGETSGSDGFNVVWTLEGGKSAYEVTEGTARRLAGGTFAANGRQLTRVTRVRGGWFTITLSNNAASKYFALERIVVHVEAGGKQR